MFASSGIATGWSAERVGGGFCDLIPVVEPLTSILSPSAKGEAEIRLLTASTPEFI
jgi:hypothetical protein